MAAPNLGRLTARGQHLLCVLTNGLEESIPFAAARLLRDEQGLGHQLCHQFKYSRIAGSRPAWVARHGLGRGKAEPAYKNRESSEQFLFGICQELVAPVERRTQRSVSRRGASASSRQQVQSVIKSRQDLLRGQHIDPRRRQFDSQWDTLQPLADLGDGRGLIFGPGELWTAR